MIKRCEKQFFAEGLARWNGELLNRCMVKSRTRGSNSPIRQQVSTAESYCSTPLKIAEVQHLCCRLTIAITLSFYPANA